MVIQSNLELLTVKEVAKMIHVHPHTLRRWSDEGLIKAYRISRRGDRRFKLEDVQSFLSEQNQSNIGAFKLFN